MPGSVVVGRQKLGEQPMSPADESLPASDVEKIEEVAKIFGDDGGAGGGNLSVRFEEAAGDGHDGKPPPGGYKRRATLRRASARPDHLQGLLRQRRASVMYYEQMDLDTKEAASLARQSVADLSIHARKKIEENTAVIKKAEKMLKELHDTLGTKSTSVEVRVDDLNYRVKVDPSQDKIQTVYTKSGVYWGIKLLKRLVRKEQKPEKQFGLVLENINLVLKPGNMYLVLGPPASGKTSLLKAIAGRLSTEAGETVEGSVLYNGISLQDTTDLIVENVITYIGQLDHHAPRLTVEETFDFAFQCKAGGTHAPKELVQTDEARELVDRLDREKMTVKLSMEALGLSHVADTFVGDSEVRGVSGGQRRRVTVGEMYQQRTPVLCADEISTGLDAQSTYDMVMGMMHFTRVNRLTRVVSLLQPSPETVSLFDEVILLAEGKVLYAGPVEAVETYFAMLGYRAPDQMDVADFLQVLSTPDGKMLFHPSSDRSTPYTMTELAQVFRESEQFEEIVEGHDAPWETTWERTQSGHFNTKSISAVPLHHKYANPTKKSISLNLHRNITLWLRDKRFLIANAVKNIIMGVSVGGVFFQTDSIVSIYGVLFQLMLFIMLGAMTSAPGAVADRVIYYKHADANFYGAFPYAVGKSVALMPQALIDVLIFGTITYWMVGLDATAGSYFTYIAVLFTFSVVMNEQLSIFAAFSPTSSDVQAFAAVILFFLIVFCGFVVMPTVIPNYWLWVYWWNPLAWAYRALVVNEFTSSSYDVIGSEEYDHDLTVGQLALLHGGQVSVRNEIFDRAWIGWAFAYLVPYAFVCTLITGACLKYKRVESSKALLGSPEDVVSVYEDIEQDGESEIEMPFTPVTLTFTDVCYDVKASTTKDTLRLLHDVTGIFEMGRMCALMGSSGAGKTTLMDCIAMRKNTGVVTGDVRMNGFEQDRKTFRRCAGYVEQFDVQAPELTVRETVLFSARLRLNAENPDFASDETQQAIVDHVLETLELTSLADVVVGTAEKGGLSFEQRKRLSIAVELAASPSIIFLDEPTSGLDARAACLVVKALRSITNQGRTVIATIHQPSSAVFEMFDDLCLLKKGGHLVYFGELGEGSRNLVEYFEELGAIPINQGENPANWMLTAITAETADDFADEYRESSQFEALKAKIQETIDKRDPSMEVSFQSEFSAPRSKRRKLLNQRLVTIYWRSPAYNLSRMMISTVIAFVLGSIFVTQRKPDFYTEQQMSSLLGTIFISFIIIGVLSIVSVLPVMLAIRDAFYRHRAAGMCDHQALSVGLGVAESRFIIVSTFLFCVIFLPMLGTGAAPGRQAAFWGFFTFNTAIYSYFGQAFMCSVRGMSTAMILASVFIGINNFFSGFIVRPQYLTGVFQFTYWITPGHYVYEGLVVNIFHENYTPVIATFGSEFWDATCSPDLTSADECTGTVSEYINIFFGDRFSYDHIWYDAVALGAYLIAARVLTYLALKHFNYTAT